MLDSDSLSASLRRLGLALVAVLALPPVTLGAQGTAAPTGHAIVPLPAEVRLTPSERFTFDSVTTVVLDASASEDVERIARELIALVSPYVRREPRRLAVGETPGMRTVHLMLDRREGAGSAEGYELTVEGGRILIRASSAQGLFHGVQTLRQLLPPAVENRGALRRTLTVPGVRVVDAPRFAWRGMMLDVSRHFLPPEDVRRFIDLLALYKFNRLHLHLSDDQGWRIEIKSWPNLARHGGSSEVGGGEGGYYTQAQYADLVAYARDRFIAIVPEIDMPGHTNAALSSYPVLNCNDQAPARYTGTRVGFSALCVERDTTYAFVRDVVREIAALTPTPWFHIGGDEVERLTKEKYRGFIERVESIVRAEGKVMVGWGEVGPAKLSPESIVQHWRPTARDDARLHAERGGKVIMSPGNRAYLDMKYDSSTVLGLTWAGIVEVRTSYDWDPSTVLRGVGERDILGVEAPLWSETIEHRHEYEYLAFPRLLAIAEVAWSPQGARAWTGFRDRLARQGPRLSALGVNFYRSPQVPWSCDGTGCPTTDHRVIP
jgi:hexosaminidase